MSIVGWRVWCDRLGHAKGSLGISASRASFRRTITARIASSSLQLSRHVTSPYLCASRDRGQPKDFGPPLAGNAGDSRGRVEVDSKQ